MRKFVVDIEERPQLIKKDGCYGCVMSVAYTFTVQSSETHLLPAGELYISPRRIGFTVLELAERTGFTRPTLRRIQSIEEQSTFRTPSIIMKSDRCYRRQDLELLNMLKHQDT